MSEEKIKKTSEGLGGNPYQALSNIAFFCRVMGWIFFVGTLLSMGGGVYASVVYLPASELSIDTRAEIIRTLGFAILVGVFATMSWFGLGGIIRLLIDVKNDLDALVEHLSNSQAAG